MPKIIVSIDGTVIKELTLAKDRTALGRRPYNDVVIDNLAVSGEHAVFHWIDAEVYVEDLNSTNGTYVNARPVKRTLLQHNDMVEVAKYKIRYLATHDDTDDVAPRAAPGGRAPVSSPMPMAPTAPVPLGGPSAEALVRVLSGPGAGREVSLKKVVTTVGKPGVAVAAITRRLHGYVVMAVDGGSLLNGATLGADAIALQDGDLLELANTRMQFVQAC